MLTVESDHIIISVNHIQAGSMSLFNCNISTACIFNEHTSCDDITSLEHTIKQMHLNACDIIAKNYFKSLRFIIRCPHCRKSLQSVFSVSDFMTLIKKLNTISALFVFDIKRNISEIACAKSRILLWQRIKRICTVHACCVRIA